MKSCALLIVIGAMTCLGNLSHAADAVPSVEIVKLSADMEVSKCVNVGSMTSNCESLELPTPPQEISIALSSCHSENDGSQDCVGTWGTSVKQDGYVFEASITVMRHDNKDHGYYVLYASVGPKSEATLPAAISIFMANGKLTNSMILWSAPLNIVKDGNSAPVSYNSSLNFGPTDSRPLN